MFPSDFIRKWKTIILVCFVIAVVAYFLVWPFVRLLIIVSLMGLAILLGAEKGLNL